VTNVPLSNGTAMAGLNNIAPGTYYWVAFYLGDTNNLPERSGCADEKVTVIQATPKIATRTKPSSALQGALLSDTAKVSGGDNPTGTVTFELFSPDDKTCSGKPAFTSQPVNLVGGSASVTSTVEAKQIGTWHWVAIYSGDTNNASVQTGCRAEPVRITAPPPPIPQTQPHHHHASCAASRDPNCDPWRNF
jgi:hypothetical protein